MSDQPIIARVYVRISKAKKGEVLGVERQLPPCEAFAHAQGWPLATAEPYTDNNKSAWKEGIKRDDFERMLADTRADHRAGRQTAIITWKADRLLRTVEDATAIVAINKECGTLVANVDGEIDLSTASGRKQFYELAVAAAYESDLKSERLKLKHAELRRNGHWQGGQRPFGYDVEEFIEDRKVKCRPVLNPAEAAEIREAARRILHNGSISGVQTDWAKRKIHRPNGGLFTGQQITHMLVSPRLTGRRKGQDADQPAQWPAILTIAEHEALVARLGPGRKPPGQRGLPDARKYLLVGFAYCGIERDGHRCGTKLRSKASEGRRRYTCEKRAGGCNGVKVVADEFEDFVRDAVITAYDTPEIGASMRHQAIGQLADPAEERDLIAQRATDRARLDQLADDYADGAFASRDQFERANRRITARLEATDERLAALRVRDGIVVELPANGDAMRQAWESWDLEARRQVLGLAIERVWLKPAGPGRRFTADRVEIDWRL